MTVPVLIARVVLNVGSIFNVSLLTIVTEQVSAKSSWRVGPVVRSVFRLNTNVVFDTLLFIHPGSVQTNSYKRHYFDTFCSGGWVLTNNWRCKVGIL
jgi:hypothetical protein